MKCDHPFIESHPSSGLVSTGNLTTRCMICGEIGVKPQPDSGRFTGAREQQRRAALRMMTPFEERRVEEMRAELRPGPIRPLTDEERAVAQAAHAVAAAGKRGIEQGRFGYFAGMIIITHPDMPPHVWDGKKMHRIEPQQEAKE